MPNPLDLVGRVFGKFMVLRRVGLTKHGKQLFLCKCECGNESNVVGGNLMSGRSTKCATCKNIPDLIGQKFGKLLVLAKAGLKLAYGNKHNYMFWKCLCDCGKEHEVMSCNLTKGRVKSCGCELSHQDSARNELWRKYVWSAKDRKHSFNLSREEFDILTQKNCDYCDAVPANKQKSKKTFYKEAILYNGIDRIDSSKGYEAGNVATCCYQCNLSKSNYTRTEFIDWVSKVYHNLKAKGELK